jgi:hypothetical protein
MSSAVRKQGLTPVAVTIARKRKKEGFSNSNNKSKKDTSVIEQTKRSPDVWQEEPSTAPPPSPDTAKKKKKSDSFRIFVEGATIYATCLILPTALGFLLRFYEDPSWWQRKAQLNVLPDDSWTGYFYDQTAYCLCPADDANSMDIISPIASYFGIDSRWWWCPEAVETFNAQQRLAHVLSPDAGWTDFGIVALFSLTLAVFRLSIVNRLVHPLEDSAKLEALVRCKSIQLLGSEYTASLTPRASMDVSSKIELMDQGDVWSLMMPSLSPTKTGTPTVAAAAVAVAQDDVSEHDFGLGLDESVSSLPHISMSPFRTADVLQHEQDQELQQLQGGPSTPPRRSSLKDDDHVRSFENMEQLEVASRQQDADGTLPLPPTPPSPRASTDRLYAAPRYATAVFRLMYCTATTGLALYWFRDANFWPWYVGGHGSTAKCWDLSGGLTMGMDSDFDQRNAVLRRYFLWQASYHWHSGAVHLISMMILLFHPQHHAQRRFLSVKTTTSAYVRSLVQHVLSLALIATVYVFSSLRRLAAIGMFAFDVSSWFLHLLQICMNAPDASRWKQAKVVSRIYTWLVIPSFVVTRFMIWPAVWYSLEVESKVWLVQLENMLMPGSALAMRCTFHFWMILLMGSTVVYFRRLLDHPHLRRILRQAEQVKEYE